MRKVPPIARPMNRMEELAAVKERMRNSFTGNIGDAARTSHHMNSGKVATAAASSPTTAGEVQPQALPCTSPRVSMNRPAAEMTMPGMSTPLSDRAFLTEAGRTMPQTTSAAMPIGTLTKKIQDQWPYVTSTPPSTGPTAAAAVPSAPHSPTAMPCWRRGNAPSTMGREMVSSAAPPRPWPARKAISQSMDGAKPHRSENSEKTTRPNMNMRLRP